MVLDSDLTLYFNKPGPIKLEFLLIMEQNQTGLFLKFLHSKKHTGYHSQKSLMIIAHIFKKQSKPSNCSSIKDEILIAELEEKTEIPSLSSFLCLSILILLFQAYPSIYFLIVSVGSAFVMMMQFSKVSFSLLSAGEDLVFPLDLGSPL